MSHLWPELPHDQAAYSAISTDFWPWPEVFADLDRRDHFSGVLEIRHLRHRARALWLDGAPLGGYSEDAEVDLAELARVFPRASLDLYSLDADVALLAWQCRQSDLQSEKTLWDEVKAGQILKGFSGIIRAASGDSFWQAGQHLEGPVPQPGEQVVLVEAPRKAISSESVIEFYNSAFGAAARHFDVSGHWRASALELADEHLCLDPFAREVVYENGQLQLVNSVSADELLPALRDAYALMLVRAGRRADELPLAGLRTHALWSQSGLGEPS